MGHTEREHGGFIAIVFEATTSWQRRATLTHAAQAGTLRGTGSLPVCGGSGMTAVVLQQVAPVINFLAETLSGFLVAVQEIGFRRRG